MFHKKKLVKIETNQLTKEMSQIGKPFYRVNTLISSVSARPSLDGYEVFFMLTFIDRYSILA